MDSNINHKEIDNLTEAINEAYRFIARANALKARLKEGDGYQLKERAAARRSSMDLTRALADFRQRS